jgi:hypothetical protein
VASFKNTIFRYEVEEIETFEEVEIGVLSQKEWENKFFRLKELHGRNWRDIFFKDFGFQMPARRPDIEVIKKAFLNVSGNRMGFYRVESKLQQTVADIMRLQMDSLTHKTLATLYSELKQKVLYVH